MFTRGFFTKRHSDGTDPVPRRRWLKRFAPAAVSVALVPLTIAGAALAGWLAFGGAAFGGR